MRSISSPSVASSKSGSMRGRRSLVQLQLGQAALVVDRHRGPVLHRALDVVDADVVPEHGARVGVLELDGRSREADERGVGQRVAHVAGEPVDEVVLAAVGLVGDDHDVVPLRQRGVGVALLLGVELLDRGEHHAPSVHRKLAAQVGPVPSLHGRLSQQVLAASEGAKELVVQVVAVGEHHDGRVFHRRLAHDRPGVESHRQALAGALRVPHHPDAPVARDRRPDGGRPRSVPRECQQRCAVNSAARSVSSHGNPAPRGIGGSPPSSWPARRRRPRTR